MTLIPKKRPNSEWWLLAVLSLGRGGGTTGETPAQLPITGRSVNRPFIPPMLRLAIEKGLLDLLCSPVLRNPG
jgi:hypothetical protein